jgi:hypothetical protein
MKATTLLHDLGQSLWLDNITRDLLDSGALRHYVEELSVTGLTSNPTIFEHAIKKSAAYDAAIRAGLEKGRSSEEIFFDLALDDITRAADLFRPIWERTNTVDGWVSLEVSPLLAYDPKATLAAREGSHRSRQAPERSHQDPWHAGGATRHRRGDLRGHSGQRHAPFLPRALARGRRCVPPRHRTARPGRPRPERRCRRLGLRQPLGQCRRRSGP